MSPTPEPSRSPRPPGRVPARRRQRPRPRDSRSPLTTELLVLQDGDILVHNLTPTFARLLRQLNPADPALGARITQTPQPGRASDRPAPRP